MIITPRVSNVIVTGGGSGIGFATAKRLIEENVRVIIVGRDTKKLQNAVDQLGMLCNFIQHDVTNVEGIPVLFEKCTKIWGSKPEGLINCAGIKTTSICNPGLQETEQGYDSLFCTNIKATVFLTRRFAEYLRDNSIQGNIVNISSAQGYSAKITTAYQMAKNNVIRFTRGIGKDFAKYDIVINGVAPGCTYSDMTPRTKNTGNKLHYNNRTLEAFEIADIICFLISEKAKCIIGDTIAADGGFVTAI